MDSSAVASALASLPSRPIVILTHKRSGTHLTIDLLRRQFAECDAWKRRGEKSSFLYLTLEAMFDPRALSPLSERQGLEILGRCARPLVKSHFLPQDLPTAAATGGGRLGRHWVDWLAAKGRTLYVYRDGRDVLCSLQLLEAKRDPRSWRPLADYIRAPAGGRPSRAEAWARHVERGLALPGAIPFRFEDLLRRTRDSVGELARSLELTPLYREPLLPKRLRSVWRARWSRLAERRPQSTAILGRPPGFELPQWRRDFTRDDREFFHRAAGGTLVRLGYEDGDGWVAADDQS